MQIAGRQGPVALCTKALWGCLTCGGPLGVNIALGLGIGRPDSPVETGPLLATQTGQSARRLSSIAVLIKSAVEVTKEGVGQVASLGLVGNDLLLVNFARGIHTLQGTTRRSWEFYKSTNCKAISDFLAPLWLLVGAQDAGRMQGDAAEGARDPATDL